MKKIIWGILATITGVVLLFSYRTSLDAVAPVTAGGTGGTGGGTGTTGTGSAGAGSTSSGSGSSTSSGPSGSNGSGTNSGGSSSSGSSSSSTTGLKNGTYTGQSADTQYGPVQVKITVSGGKITAVDVPVYPTESFRDQEINQQAVPQLVSETLSAQSANIQMVSGATFTSGGYEQSLQSALDEAKS